MSSQAATSSTPSPTTMSVSLRTDSPLSAREPPGHLDNVSQEDGDVATSAGIPLSPRRPLRIYTRPQLLSLSQSPMVKPPPDMPDLRTWFGIENEILINKKDEPPAPNSARERRFRRDDDGDTSSRPTFRSALQPSQMGNFKHQSLRDRDREVEKERDKDGHERLRHLSDKFDRDRLLPLSGSRNKDREATPSSTRGQPAPLPNGISRRADARESAKKKVGEANEDWRRGGETPRSAREDRPENSRRDREDRNRDRDRERARSRHRDSSRSNRETSSSRRDRDRDDDDDGGRHWRDDGKRDERMAARRERERARGQERESDDRRWHPGEDRDGGRYKRGTGRERKTVGTADDVKEKEDRQKEKEPAWMDTYIPSESTSGILGGQDPNGKLDGIQAWKKDLKEKDTREREVTTTAVCLSKTITEPVSSAPDFADNHLDEIQIFRLLMKKEEAKKRLEENTTAVASEVVSLSSNDDDRTRQRNSSADDLTANLPSVQNKTSLTSLSSSASVHASPTPPFNLKDAAALTSVKVNQDSLHDRVIGPARVSPIAEFTAVTATKTPSELAGAAFPPVGSRVLAMKNKTAAAVNPASNIQSLNAGLPNAVPESLQIFSKNDPLRPHGSFSPFDDPNRSSYALDDARELSAPPNQGGPQRLPVDQLFSGSVNSQTDANYNSSLSKGSRLAKIFENKSRDMPAVTSKPLQTGYTSPASNPTQRQEINSLGTNPVHSVEELMAMLNNSSQRNNPGLQSNPHLNNNLNNGVPGLLPLQQQQQILQQQQPSTNRLEPLYESRTEDRSFVPDGMVPGLRTAPPRRESLGHFNDPLDESLPYNLQRLTQQPQGRGLEQLFNNPVTPLFNQQIGRPSTGVPLQPLQQNQFRGGSSPALNATSTAPQRLPPGLANLGGRPPHDPSQYLGLQQNLPSLGLQHGIHGSNPLSQHQIPFNGYNVSNAVGLSTRVPVQNNLLQNSASQQFNLGHHGLDPRLSNHHHLMGIGGSGITGNRITGGFPQQAPNGPNHVSVRPQQQQQLPPHLLPQLMPHHMQQGHPSSNTPQNHDLMAVLMGAPHRE